MTETILAAGFSLADRTRPMIDGRVTVPGYGFEMKADHVHSILPLARKGELALCELSITDHTVATARRDTLYHGLPIFMSRGYRHTALLVREGAGIDKPTDLAGRTMGLPLYQQSASVWVRGLLRDLYGVDTKSIAWRAGGVEKPEPARLPKGLPTDLDVKAIGDDQTLVGLVEAGQLDALIAPRLEPIDGLLRRLFADTREAEENYFRATGFFPMMHLIGVRKDLVEADPALPAALTRAFMQAKALAIADLQTADFLRVSLPWLTEYRRDIEKLMGKNYWRYGYAESRDELTAMARYVVEDGLADRTIDPAELFHPSTLDIRDAA